MYDRHLAPTIVYDHSDHEVNGQTTTTKTPVLQPALRPSHASLSAPGSRSADHRTLSAPLPVIPRTALTGSHVYLADEGERLEQRLVEVAFLQGEIAVIAAGLETGERVVVSDPVPAIEGMRLEVTHDDLLRDRVQREATNRDEPT